ncbi:response regulator [Paenibacillus agricola]|uniref:Response regulator n=1 Tax=Paenibacillus agricola TaxID=2716264 RepID=A0ABX0JA43_9BACL|nr:response regulator [Paenibacillus agricola]NHN31044.1 response regulator [Paenibacillus agricola]
MAKIIITDDAAFMRRMLNTVVTDLGHEVVAEAANGLEAIALYKVLRPDLVMMDITMPEMDGILAVQHIIKHDPRARIIMCSAMGQIGMVKAAIDSGARDFLVKPFQKERIEEAIGKVLNI